MGFAEAVELLPQAGNDKGILTKLANGVYSVWKTAWMFQSLLMPLSKVTKKMEVN